MRIVAQGRPIAADSGHAAPYVHDVDHDGKKDLLVGQFGGGTCRVHWNEDGKLDLLLGNCEEAAGATTGEVFLFLRK